MNKEWTDGDKKMIFTDDDLKRLHAEYTEMGSDKIDALIIRLEAAEEALGYFHDHIETSTGYHTRSLLGDSHSKWRKAAGK